MDPAHRSSSVIVTAISEIGYFICLNVKQVAATGLCWEAECIKHSVIIDSTMYRMHFTFSVIDWTRFCFVFVFFKQHPFSPVTSPWFLIAISAVAECQLVY